MISPKEALEQAKWLYDQLALSPLGAAAKYGDEYEPPTDEQCLEIREMLNAAIPVAELEHQAADMIGEIVTYLREDGEIEFDSQIYNDADDLHSRLKTLK